MKTERVFELGVAGKAPYFQDGQVARIYVAREDDSTDLRRTTAKWWTSNNALTLGQLIASSLRPNEVIATKRKFSQSLYPPPVFHTEEGAFQLVEGDFPTSDFIDFFKGVKSARK